MEAITTETERMDNLKWKIYKLKRSITKGVTKKPGFLIGQPRVLKESEEPEKKRLITERSSSLPLGRHLKKERFRPSVVDKKQPR